MMSTSEINDSVLAVGSNSPSLDSLPTEEFLRIVGLRVRAQRASMGMSRKRLAEVSGVSERYLAQLESGQGNMSIALLRKVTTAIGMSLAMLLCAETPELTAPTNGEAGRFVNGQASTSSGNSSAAFVKTDISQTSVHMQKEAEL